MAETFQPMIAETSDTEKYIETLRRSEHLQPEKDLLLAILHDAIDTYRKYRGARDPEGKQQFLDAEEWIWEEGEDWVFSFQHICDCLGLNPDYIRRGVRESLVRAEAEEKSRHRRGTRRQAA